MKLKLYDLVKQILEDHPQTRNSDKKLIWRAFYTLGLTENGRSITLVNFMLGPSVESLRRARQLIQAKYPELRGSEEVTAKRREKEATKSTWVYREVVTKQQTLI